MNNKCVNLRIRKKKGQAYYYCIQKRTVVDFKECSSCLNKEYKKVTKIKPISKKRITVSKKTYEEVYERWNGRCSICETNQNLHLHHIDGRGKYKTNDPNNCIVLCSYCHLEVVHKNNKYWRCKLKEMI